MDTFFLRSEGHEQGSRSFIKRLNDSVTLAMNIGTWKEKKIKFTVFSTVFFRSTTGGGGVG